MNTTPISEATWKEWKKKRKRTMIGYIIISAIIGMDYSIILPTLYFYLKDMIKTPKPELYYGVAVCMYCLSSSLFGFILARLVDKTRKIRAYTNIISGVSIVGSLLYVVPYSVVYPILARALMGISETFGDVCAGEVIRIYSDDEGTRMLYWLSSAYTVGFIIGPAVNILYQSISFDICSLHINYLNFGGIFMAILLTLILLINNVWVDDCSAIIDFKEYSKKEKEKENIAKLSCYVNKLVCSDDVSESMSVSIDFVDDKSKRSRLSSESDSGVVVELGTDVSLPRSPSLFNVKKISASLQSVDGEGKDSKVVFQAPQKPITKPFFITADEQRCHSNDIQSDAKKTTKGKQRKHIPLTTVLKVLFTNIESAIVLSSSLVFMYLLFAFDLLLPLIITKTFKWDVKIVMFAYLAYGILTLIVLIAMSWGCTKGGRIYYLALLCYICVILLFTALELIHWTKRGLGIDITILSLALVFSVFGWCLLDVLLRSILAKLVPSCIQGFTEVVRTTLSKISVIAASLTGPLLLPYLHWWSIASIIVIAILLFLFVKRRKYLTSVEEISRLQNSIKIKQVSAF